MTQHQKMEDTMASEILDGHVDSSLETDGAPFSGQYRDISNVHTNLLHGNNGNESGKRKRESLEEKSNSSESSFELGACLDTGDRYSSGDSSSDGSDSPVGLESPLSDLDISGSDSETNTPREHNTTSNGDIEAESHTYSTEDNLNDKLCNRKDPTKSKVNIENDGGNSLNGCLEPLDGSCASAHAHEVTGNSKSDAQETKSALDDLDPLSDNTCVVYDQDKDGDTLLHIAVILKAIPIATLLIQFSKQQHLNIRNNLYQTPLHLAVLTKLPDVVRALVQAGACIHLQDAKGRTPVHIACEQGNTCCNPTPNHDDSDAPFEEGASMIRVLLEADWALNERLKIDHPTTFCSPFPVQRSPTSTMFAIADYEGQFPIHVAASNGDLDLVKMLVTHGDDVNRPERKSGRTALHMAAEMGHQAIAEYLLDQETIKIDQKTRGDETAIAIAFHRREDPHGNAKVYDLLKDKGAKVDLKYFAKFGIATAEINKRFRSVSMENDT